MKRMKSLLPLVLCAGLLNGCALLGITDPDPNIPITEQAYADGMAAGRLFLVVKTLDPSEVTSTIDVILKQVKSGVTGEDLDKIVYALLVNRYGQDGATKYYTVYAVLKDSLHGLLKRVDEDERFAVVVAFLQGASDAGIVVLPELDEPAAPDIGTILDSMDTEGE